MAIPFSSDCNFSFLNWFVISWWGFGINLDLLIMFPQIFISDVVCLDNFIYVGSYGVDRDVWLKWINLHYLLYFNSVLSLFYPIVHYVAL